MEQWLVIIVLLLVLPIHFLYFAVIEHGPNTTQHFVPSLLLPASIEHNHFTSP